MESPQLETKQMNCHSLGLAKLLPLLDCLDCLVYPHLVCAVRTFITETTETGVR
jgi:hypothetical protein